MSKTIVLIDDDPDDLDIMKETIEKAEPSAQCISFLYPDEAIRVLTNELIIVPDYIIIDMNMPRKNGLECLKELRSQEEFHETPIIIYSTTVSPGVRDTLIKHGATHVFQKPAKYEAWSSAIKKVLGRDWAFFCLIGMGG